MWDLIIIGGGPAGAATAIAAQHLDCRTLLLESKHFPREHVGESTVYLWPMLDYLGVADRMEATFQHKYGSTRIWGQDATPHSSDFSYFSQDGTRPYSLQVERAQFDAILLERAQDAGATVLQGHHVTEVLWEGERAVGVRYRAPDRTAHEVHAPFVIDASGRACMIGRSRGLTQIDPFYPDLSVFAYVRNARLPDGDRAGDLLIEAVPWGWFWFIPLHTGEVSVGLVCDRSSRAILQQSGLRSFFEQAVAQATAVRRMLADVTIARGPFATTSSGYTSTSYAGRGWLSVGDAAQFVDPMWATGVANALNDGLLAAAVVEAVQKGRLSEEDALSYYQQVAAGRAEYLHAVVKFVYGANQLFGEHPFWQARHAQLSQRPLSLEILRKGGMDAFGGYFKAAFEGMGVQGEIIQALSEGVQRRQRLRQPASELPANLLSWVPTVNPALTFRRGIIFTPEDGRLTEGLEIENAGDVRFISQSRMIDALKRIDGRRTVEEVIGDVLLTVASEDRPSARLGLLLGMTGAHQEGILQAAR